VKKKDEKNSSNQRTSFIRIPAKNKTKQKKAIPPNTPPLSWTISRKKLHLKITFKKL